MPSISDLNKRATFEKPSRVSDGRGGWKIADYVPYVTVWAELKAKTRDRDREKVDNQQKQTSMTYILTIRYREDITADMRAVIKGKKFYLTKLPYDPDGRRRWLSMECEERAE